MIRRSLTVLTLLVLSAQIVATAQSAKKPVTSEADLPRYTYAVPGSASQLLQADPATFDAFAEKVLADVNATLDGYDIKDHATLRGLLSEKLSILTLLGKNQDALALVQQIRDLQDKADLKLTSGLRIEATLKARIATGQTSGDAFNAAFQKNYAAAVNALPYDVAGTSLKEAKESVEIGTPALQLGTVQSSLDPSVEKTHTMSGDYAAQIINVRFYDEVIYPTRAPALAVLTAYLAKNAAATKPDIWAARDVSLAGVPGLTPVVVAIWDGGSDLSLFPNQTFTDPHPTTYDAHGLAFDLHGFLTHGYLVPITPEQKKQYPSLIADDQGFSDLQANIDSPQATALKQKLAAMTPAQSAAFFESLDFVDAYGPGTHVAGIAVRDNPAARLLVGLMTYNWKTIPPPPTDADVERGDADNVKYIDYFKAHGVRVVNMSFGETAQGYEAALEANGLGKDAATRKQIAQRWYAQDKKSFYDVMKSAPNILFIAAAGNANSDPSFGDDIPSSLSLPNLLTVGAVDQAGDPASFTSYGPTVRVYANGYEVESYLPGGYRVRLDGTSMAAPNVTNLAAKLFAIDPSLTPVQAIDLIVKGATPSADGKRALIDPKASIELLKAQMAAKKAT
jgi:subtilisin family serine protease